MKFKPFTKAQKARYDVDLRAAYEDGYNRCKAELAIQDKPNKNSPERLAAITELIKASAQNQEAVARLIMYGHADSKYS